HNEPDPPDGTDVLRRITFKRDQVGELTGAKITPVREMEGDGVTARSLAHDVEGGKAVFIHQQLHFTRVVTVRENTHVTAHNESYPGLPGCFHTRSLRSDFFGF